MQYYNQNVYLDPEQYRKNLYINHLKKDSTKLGILLIIIEILSIILGLILMSIDRASSTSSSIIISGLLSLLIFFVPSLLFVLIGKYDMNDIFPFQKVSGGLFFTLIAFGLASALAANYVSQMFDGVLGWFDLDPSISADIEATTTIEIILQFISVAILPALVEEFLFRGVILGVLKKYSAGAAILISGTLFGLMHANFSQIPFAIPVGIILGYIAIKTNSLLPTMIIHCLNNSISVVLELLYNSENISKNTVGLIEGITMTIISVLGIVSIFYLIKENKKHPEKNLFKFNDSNNIIPYRQKMELICTRGTLIAFATIVLLESILLLFMP